MDASGLPEVSSPDRQADAAAIDDRPLVAPEGGADVVVNGDAAIADASRDGGVTDAATADGDAGGDGGADPCKPPCLLHLVNGCLPAGGCTRQGNAYCYGNGVKQVNAVGGSQQTSKNGVLCYTLASSGDLSYTYSDPAGATLGTATIGSDGSETITCPGGAPVTISASCPSPAADCMDGTCN